jgi:prophage regulatory protein
MYSEIKRQSILNQYGYLHDRLVREAERKEITSISRTRAWQLEKSGDFPARKKLGLSSCAWLLSDLLLWIHSL